MNMFKASQAKTVDEYLAQVPPERQETVNYLHNLIQKSSPSFKPFFAYNMLGYGNFKYKNYKKETINWPIIALASQKNYISLYVCAVKDGKYIAETNKDKLGKVSVGKSCIRFKKLEDLDQEALKDVLKQAADSPGLEGVGASAK